MHDKLRLENGNGNDGHMHHMHMFTQQWREKRSHRGVQRISYRAEIFLLRCFLELPLLVCGQPPLLTPFLLGAPVLKRHWLARGSWGNGL